MLLNSASAGSIGLATRYLPVYHFSERHDIAPIAAPVQTIMNSVKNYDDQQDRILNILLKIREMPARLAVEFGGKNALASKPRFGLDNFLVLEESPTELAFGLIGRFWRPDYGLIPIENAEQFLSFKRTGVPKLIMVFSIEPSSSATQYCLRTETRIWCPDTRSRLSFIPYWIAIRIASGWIRRRMLSQIKHDAERSLSLL